jgi:hypothetical protein
MSKKIFDDFDFSDFWDDSEYSLSAYVEESPTDELILSVEQELGYKLPASYIELMKLHNGGIPKKGCFPTTESTSWAEDHCALAGFMGIGRTKAYSLCGSLGSKFMIEEWLYPNTGVYICDCPSAEHDMIMLDYDKCGNGGQPEVVHVDQEWDYKKTFLAKDFETFIRGLVSSAVFDTSEQDLIDTIETLRTGRFSDVLQEYFKKDTTVNFDTVLRNLFTELTKEKGFLGLHGDELSHLAYDIQFYLLSINRTIETREEFAKEYPPMVAMGNHEISIGAYADFFLDWFDKQAESEQIVKKTSGGLTFTDGYKRKLFEQINKYE